MKKFAGPLSHTTPPKKAILGVSDNLTRLISYQDSLL
jgi:hypothetical protein